MPYLFDPELAGPVAMLPEFDFRDLPAARAKSSEMIRLLGRPDETGVQIEDRTIPGPEGDPDLTLRIYVPDDIGAPAAIYHIHSGGFIAGDLETEHAWCVDIARQLGIVVIAINYRLAPESPYPGPLEDVYTGLVWMASNAAEFGIDPKRIAVHGVSAGGGLAAALTLLARDRRGPAIAFQFLAVPEVDDRLTTPSATAFVDTPMWDRNSAIISWNAYLGEGVPGTDSVPAYAAPARATDLTNLPSAYVSTMEFDPLRDEGIAYALALLHAGVPVELHLLPGTFHGSRLVPHATISQRELDEEVAVLRRALQL
ncbi:alpha/beta hydrolase [Rhodococcus qingshengii]|uniref:alpha/beta hydrolase n=1 Tax=Rhodococcus qingshengii TaxID=334542 RepID=UPI0010A5E7BF|nr:alpha/beta hydrolase [Rhodococcus qingshengii]THJ66123.1 alpha/beta hydrolase [Rhodococcus qingshengii]